MSSQLAATLGPSAYWYLARATGIVSLLLLTASVVLGVLGPLRFTVPGRWPRFVIDTLHRDVSLLVIAVLVIHIVTSILDGFAPINLLDAVLPFRSAYRPLWMGLGAFSFDFLLALVITSLVRRRLGYRAWRAIHWLAYASWPVAVLHGLGTGSDTKTWWNLALTAVCLLAVVAAVWARIKAAAPVYGGFRQAAIALTVATPIGLAIFTLAGPLQSGWARRAGTPVSLLAQTTPAAPSVSARSSARPPSSFSAQLSGSLQQTSVDGGATVELGLRLSGGANGRLRVRLGGQPVGGGGLSMTGSQVDLLTGASLFQGSVTALQGQEFTARVRSADGSTLRLQLNLDIDQAGNSVSGSLQARPDGAS
jgi:methionine sulfoxide reductase heme-binding subunit